MHAFMIISDSNHIKFEEPQQNMPSQLNNAAFDCLLLSMQKNHGPGSLLLS